MTILDPAPGSETDQAYQQGTLAKNSPKQEKLSILGISPMQPGENLLTGPRLLWFKLGEYLPI